MLHLHRTLAISTASLAPPALPHIFHGEDITAPPYLGDRLEPPVIFPNIRIEPVTPQVTHGRPSDAFSDILQTSHEARLRRSQVALDGAIVNAREGLGLQDSALTSLGRRIAERGRPYPSHSTGRNADSGLYRNRTSARRTRYIDTLSDDESLSLEELAPPPVQVSFATGPRERIREHARIPFLVLPPPPTFDSLSATPTFSLEEMDAFPNEEVTSQTNLEAIAESMLRYTVAHQ